MKRDLKTELHTNIFLTGAFNKIEAMKNLLRKTKMKSSQNR